MLEERGLGKQKNYARTNDGQRYTDVNEYGKRNMKYTERNLHTCRKLK